MAEKTEELRLAFRVEGQFWNCYVAESDTMEGARLVGSVLFDAARSSAAVKSGFISLMKSVFEEIAEAATGAEVSHWVTTPAPEHERSGHG